MSNLSNPDSKICFTAAIAADSSDLRYTNIDGIYRCAKVRNAKHGFSIASANRHAVDHDTAFELPAILTSCPAALACRPEGL